MAISNWLKLDYIAAKKQIAEFEDAINDCDDLLKQAKKLRSNIPDNWQGEAASAAIQKLEEWESELKKIKTDMQTCKNRIAKKVEQLNNIDQSASGGGGSRGSGSSRSW